MKKKPLPHQADAVKNVVHAVQRNALNRLAVVMPCGTGKTLVQLWAAEALKAKTVLVLLPSLALIRQTLKEWMAETRWRKANVLCVCSDDTVGRGSTTDDVRLSPEDVGYPVTTDGDEVARFLKDAEGMPGTTLVFSTYHSSPLVAAGAGSRFTFDLAVFDEAHVTAGKEGGSFSFALKDENLRIAVRTFWTATPRHYDVSMDDGDDQPLVYSMDDESVYGPQVHTLSFSKAVKLGIICDYEVLVSVITNAMVGTKDIDNGQIVIRGHTVPAKTVAHHMALREAIKRHGIKKVFSFHPSVADAEEFTNGGPRSVAARLPKGFRTAHVNGAMTVAEREDALQAFRDASRALMSNARCLTQGIDVPSVDMVAFLSKKRSVIDIVQATGRAMRRAEGKTKGYILVPLYIEQEQGESLDDAVHRADFREVWAVLNALREQDETMAETVSRIKMEQAASGGSHRSIDKVTIIGPHLELEQLRKSITTICVDRLVRTRALYATWQEASVAARGLGISSQRRYRNAYRKDSRLPGDPNQTYADFPGWPEFLGTTRGFYPDWRTAGLAARRLRISSREEYWKGYNKDRQLHSNPHKLYADFPGWSEFLGWPPRSKFYPDWRTAGLAARRLGISSSKEYRKKYGQDPRLPSTPHHKYKDFPSWPTFLGK